MIEPIKPGKMVTGGTLNPPRNNPPYIATGMMIAATIILEFLEVI